MKQGSVHDPLTIRVSGLSNGTHHYELRAKPEEIGLESNFSKDVLVDATLQKNGKQLYLNADITASAQFSCDRCTEPFEQLISNRYSMLYVYSESDSAKHPPEEVTVISSDTVTISLAEDVRQMVMLAVPLKLLCKEECKGLCPRCGTNWNHRSCKCNDKDIDPRWQGLQQLLRN